MSGATIIYTFSIGNTISGETITSMCLAPSTYGSSYYQNGFFFGTISGKIYFGLEDLGNITSPLSLFTTEVTGYSGTLSGAIVGMTTDPAGKYLFFSAPSDGKLLRCPLGSFYNTGFRSLKPDSNIYGAGANTGGIAVNSQNRVYFVMSNGNGISYSDNYGNGFVNRLFLQPEGSNSIFEGLVLSGDETRIYTGDNYTGNIYYYDFLSAQTSLQHGYAAPVETKLTSLAILSADDVLYTRTAGEAQGVYLFDTLRSTNVQVAGGGSTTNTTFAQNYEFNNPSQILIDSQGVLYVISETLSDSQLFTRIKFNPFIRAPIVAPIPSPQFPNCGLPAPGNCKKVVTPFNPTTYWNLLSPQRIAIRRPGLAGCNSLANCYNTFVQLCPTIQPIRVNPNPPPPPPVVIPPFFPLETPSTQAVSIYTSTGSLPTLVSKILTPRPFQDFSRSMQSYYPMAFGPQGYIYFMTSTGTLNILDTSGGNFPLTLLRSIQQPTNVTGSPVIASSTGTIAFITNSQLLSATDQFGNVLYSYQLPPQSSYFNLNPGLLFVDTQSLLITAYSNVIMGLDISTGNIIWTNTLGNDYFAGEISTDGISVFGGTRNCNVASYSVVTGSNYWIYPTGLGNPILRAPSITSTPTGNFMAFGISNIIKVIDCSPARSRNNLDITVTLSGIGTIGSSAPPTLYTDRGGITWLYFVCGQKLYAAGGFFGTGNTTYIDSSGSQMGGNFWKSFESNVIATTPVIDGNEAVYVPGNLPETKTGRIYRYATPPATSEPSVFPASPNYFQWGVESSITTPPIISSQNRLYFNTWDSITNRNYIFTIST
jgi:hypothetical protein